MNVANVKRCIKSALLTKILKLIHVETGKIGPAVNGSEIGSGSGADGSAASGYGKDASGIGSGSGVGMSCIFD